jgi:hypothetical protein
MNISNTNNWELCGASWWDDTNQAIKFNLRKAGGYRTCAISQIVLNDYFKTENSKNAAIMNFQKHSSQVRLLAIRLIKDCLPNEDGVFFFTSETCKEEA